MTVLFADVAGYTSTSEKLDPEEVHLIMDGYFKILMDDIHKYEGTINQFTGDGVMALFGAPIAHEDNAQRACYAALAIQKALEPYHYKLKHKYGIEFKIRIGLNSGLVVVGAIGDDLRMDYTAIGDATNLASRMQVISRPGRITASGNTYRLARDYFDFFPRGGIEVKGKEEPQEAFELVGVGEARTRIAAAANKGFTRYVGQEDSMAALIMAYEKVCVGSGQVVGIVGEAGVGKSRLLFEFKNRIPPDSFIYLEGRCLHFGGAIAYFPILDILRCYFGIGEGEKELTIKRKMQEKIIEFGDELKGILSPLQGLLSIRIDDKSFLHLEPKERREKSFEGIRDLMIRASQERPLIIAIEDLHWIDKTSQDFLDYLVGWLANSHILLILLYRPEYTHQWTSTSYYTKVGVAQLGAEKGNELIKAILQEAEIASELKNLIFDRTSGNPLFMEEFTYSLIENGAIIKQGNAYTLSRKASDIQTPASIQGIIAARMDRLEENLKRTMQVASVIGRLFSYRILEITSGMQAELKACLLHLQKLEFIYEKRLFPELEYIFKHALTQEVAYNSLLIVKRKEIHERIGSAIEQIYSDRLEDFYEILAYHYSKSENCKKALNYWHLAGKRALQLYSIDEATGHFNSCIQMIEKYPDGDAKLNIEMDLKTKLGFAYLMRNQYSKAYGAVKYLYESPEKEKYPRSLGRIYTILGVYYFMEELDLEKGIDYLERSMSLSAKENDIPALSFASLYIAVAYRYNGGYEKTRLVLNSIIPLLERKQNWYTLSVPYFGMTNLFCDSADSENAEIWCRKALECIVRLDDPFTRCWGKLAMGTFCLQKGRFEEAEDNLTSALNSALDISLIQAKEIALSHLVRMHIRRERYFSALSDVNRLKVSIHEGRSPKLFLKDYLVLHAEVLMALGKGKQAFDCLARAMNYNVPYFEGELYRAFGNYYRTLGRDYHGKAKNWFQKAIKQHEKINMRLEFARDHVCLGEIFAEDGRWEHAAEHLNSALDVFKSFEAGWDIGRAKAIIASLK